jgi:hypothetical protein
LQRIKNIFVIGDQVDRWAFAGIVVSVRFIGPTVWSRSGKHCVILFQEAMLRRDSETVTAGKWLDAVGQRRPHSDHQVIHIPRLRMKRSNFALPPKPALLEKLRKTVEVKSVPLKQSSMRWQLTAPALHTEEHFRRMLTQS